MAVSKIPYKSGKVLLWTNPNPDAEFGWGTPVYAPGYKEVEVWFRLNKYGSEIGYVGRLEKGMTGYACAVTGSSGPSVGAIAGVNSRKWYFQSDNAVRFENASICFDNGTYYAENAELIPYKIYGIT